jgi:hypothetical protein
MQQYLSNLGVCRRFGLVVNNRQENVPVLVLDGKDDTRRFLSLENGRKLARENSTI